MKVFSIVELEILEFLQELSTSFFGLLKVKIKIDPAPPKFILQPTFLTHCIVLYPFNLARSDQPAPEKLINIKSTKIGFTQKELS